MVVNLETAVERLVRELSGITTASLPRALVRTANETFRILDTKARPGSLGRNDRPASRAAVVVEHVCRQQLREQGVSLSALAKAAGTRLDKLQELQNSIGHYLQPVAAAAPQKTNATENKAIGNRGGTDAITGAPSAPVALEARGSILPDLAIALAARVPDPQGCVRAARRLLDDIHHCIETSARSASHYHAASGYRHELRRFHAAYEATAFYYAALAQQNVPQPADGRGRRAGAGRATATADDEEDSSGAGLSLYDLEKASSELNIITLRSTYQKVLDWVHRLEEQKASEKSAAGPTVLVQDQGTKRRRDSTNDGGDEMDYIETQARTDAPTAAKSLQEEQRAASQQWRTEVLASAIERARETLVAQRGGDAQQITDRDCLVYAANEVFRKYGLVDT